MIAAVVAAATGLLARDANGHSVLPIAIVALLQAPLIIISLRRAIHEKIPSQILLFAIVIAGSIGAALLRKSSDPALIGISLFVIGLTMIDYLQSLLTRIEATLTNPTKLIRLVALPWLIAVIIAAALLSLPIGTNPGVPDYRHNLLLHLVSCTHAAFSTGCLTGTMSFDFGSDLSQFGQIVLYLLTQLSGFGFAAIGLALVSPLLKRPPTLKRVYLVIVALQVVGAAVLWTAWKPADASTISERTWWSLLHGGSALWNTGLTLRPDGLAAYFESSRVFLSMTTLTIAGSLGIPLLIVLMRSKEKTPTNDAPAPFESIVTLDAMLAFLLLAMASAAIWYFEHPASLMGDWRPTRPFEPSVNRPALVDLPDGRWAMSVLVAATVRSAGLQSIPVSTGTLTWATYGLLFLLMFVGGGLAGTAGGLRTTIFGVGITARSRRPSIWRRLLLGLGLWSIANAVAVVALGLTTNAETYDTAFEAVAAINNVGMSTGLTPHLSTAGRLVVTAILIVGRFWPLFFWAGTIRKLTQNHSNGIPSSTK